MTEPAAGAEQESAPTVVDVRAPKSIAPSTRDAASTGVDTSSKTGAGSRSTSVITARETLHLQEVAQTRAFVRITSALAVIVACAISFLGGDPFAKRILYGALAAVVVSCVWLARELRDDEGYSIGKVLICGYVCIGAAFCAIHFFGVFSPAVVIIPFGLCFFSSGGHSRGTLAIYLTCALLELMLGVLTIVGIIPDRGIVSGASVAPIDSLAMLILIEAVFLATYAIMRASRAATLHAIELHDSALGQIAQREALLKEARQDLAQALKAGGIGRFTDRELGGFRLGNVIGRGAMGEVYEAIHTTNKTPAAVKVLLDHVLAQPEQVQRFFREAKLAAALNVPNVVRILAVADIDAALPWLAMERLHGVDLADWLREHRRMSMSRLLNLIRQLGVGLDAAREAGIVHRDLKPRNVFLAKEGDRELWKILDFGVSKLVTDDATLTRDKIVGTPTYMAPEQVEGGKVTHRTDLFALGVIAYRVLTGRPAFAGDSEGQILYKVVHRMPPRPSTIVSCPTDLDAALAIALAKDPRERFDTAAELGQALEAAGRSALGPELRARADRVLLRHPWEE
jgi:tRNA A-37 threonylcarbamoyl transferase component Bud32